MKPNHLLVVSIVLLALMGAALFAYIIARRGPKRTGLSRLQSAGRDLQYNQAEDDDVEELADNSFDEEASSRRVRSRSTKEPNLEERLFMAGKLSEEERRDFRQKQVLAPLVLGVAGLGLGFLGGSFTMVLLGGLLGILAGLYLPLKMVDTWIRTQHEDISYYLPLVIEQIAIGVSSSLDIGPCLARIVQMADERKSHNPVTQLLKYAQFYIKSGVSLEEALTEIGRASGHAELKHVFLALSQVAKFGGEISKQLQDLADTVASQREAKIDARIKRLELKATGPVMLVFLGYLIILFLGVGAQILANY
jgi:Flp pilus assembly protein TadB